MVRRRRPAPVLAGLLGVVLVATACSDDDGGAGGAAEGTGVRVGGSIAYAAEQESPGFNNLTTKDSQLELRHIMRHVWPYAYRARPDFTVEPTPVLDGPAEVVSEDPFTVEWTIAEEAVWDDGTPVSAEDFEFNYRSCNARIDPGEETARDEASGQDVTALDCASTAGYDQVTRFERAGQKRFRMTFEAPYVEYEGLFGDPMPPAHLAKRRPGGFNTGFDEDPGASAGPYKLKEVVKGDHYTLVRNERWWGPRPKLDTIVFRAIPDPSTHPDALRNDEVQVIYPRPQVDLVRQIESIPGVRSEVNFGPTWEHLDFNLENELLAIREVRQAIAHGLDRDRYVTTLMKPFSPEARRLDNRVFMSNQAEYEAHGEEYATRSVPKATAAMERAGFTKGADGIYAKGGRRASFRIRAKAPDPQREQLEQLVRADLEGVGIELRIENFSEPESIGSVGSKGDYDLFVFAWVGTPFEVGATQKVYSAGGESNFGGYANPKVDALVEKAGVTLDDGARAEILNEIDEILWEDLPNIPLFQKPVGLLAYSARYANISDNTTSEGPFWDSINWGLKATAG